MGYLENLKDSFHLLLFKDEAVSNISQDKNATLYAIYTVIISSLASLLGILTWYVSIIHPIVFLVKTFIMHVLALMFGGSSRFEEFFRPMGATHVAYWITAIPILGILLRPIIFLYLIPVEIKIVRQTHNISLERSIVVVMLPVFLIIVGFVLLLIYLFSLLISALPF